MENNNIDKKYEIKVDLSNFVFDVVGKLPKRPQEVVTKRFNLDGKGIRTLDQIGKEYGVTRERVRQIESEGINKLKIIAKEHNIDQVFAYIKQAIENHGGLMSEEHIAEYLFGSEADSGVNKQIALLILTLDDEIKNTKEIKIHKKLYFYDDENVRKFKEIISEIEKYLLERKENLEFEKIIELANECAARKGFNKLSRESISSYLNANKIIIKNILNQWGHEKWPHINPKSIRDKAYIALKKSEDSLHFTEIAEKINGIWTNKKKKANKQTVHNELIKDDRFVLIGRGIYALKEWGYSPGTVLDVIIEVLKGKDQMGQDDIIGEVSKKRKVRKNTIILNLQNKKYFEKLPGKIYKLKAQT